MKVPIERESEEAKGLGHMLEGGGEVLALAFAVDDAGVSHDDSSLSPSRISVALAASSPALSSAIFTAELACWLL